jgi:hypothetical protein
MSDTSFYRAKPALRADLLDFKGRYGEFVQTVVKPFSDEWPHNQPVRDPFGGVVGFEDNHPEDPPEGLSRSQKRGYLIPVRGKKGAIWQERLDTFQTVPRLQSVLERHNVPSEVTDLAHSRICLVDWMDFGDDGAVLFLNTDFNPVPDAVEVMPRSEFWALHEARCPTDSS